MCVCGRVVGARQKTIDITHPVHDTDIMHIFDAMQ